MNMSTGLPAGVVLGHLDRTAVPRNVPCAEPTRVPTPPHRVYVMKLATSHTIMGNSATQATLALTAVTLPEWLEMFSLYGCVHI